MRAAGSAGDWLESWYCGRYTRCHFVNALRCRIPEESSPGWSGSGSNNHSDCSCTGCLSDRETMQHLNLAQDGAANHTEKKKSISIMQ